MASYNTYTGELKQGTNEKTVITDGVAKSTTHTQDMNATNKVTLTGLGINAGGVQLSPEQAAQYGYVDVPKGKSAEQAIRDAQMANEIDDYLNRHSQEQEHLEQPKAPSSRTLSPNQKITLAQKNTARKLMGKPEMTEAEFLANEDQLNAKMKALSGDPDSSEALPHHYRLDQLGDDEAARIADQFNTVVSPTDRDMLAASVIDGVDLSEAKLAELTSRYGLQHPSDLLDNINMTYDALESQVEKYATDRGVNFEDFKAWANENMPKEARAAAMQQLQSHDPRAFKGVMDAYAQHAAVSNPAAAMEALEAAGIPAMVSGKQVLVTLDGMQMPLQKAIQMGLLNASFS